MQRLRIGPRRQIRNAIELPQELTDDLAGIFALAQLLHGGQDAIEGIFGLRDGELRIELALLFEAPVMFEELFAEELRQALTGRTAEHRGLAIDVQAREATF